jgi:hypothetical protein
MNELPIALDLTDPVADSWGDLRTKQTVHQSNDLKIGVFPHGMQSGAPSVAIRIDLPDGSSVPVQRGHQIQRHRIDSRAESDE